jgi:hypothetical protein
MNSFLNKAQITMIRKQITSYPMILTTTINRNNKQIQLNN